MKRDNTQRPRLSVPSQYARSPPTTQAGGNCADIRSCSSGSCSAISGASSAASTRTPTSAAPTQSRGPPRFNPAIQRDGGPSALSGARSTMAQPRIEQRDHEIDAEIERDEENGEGQDQALDQREIAIDHRVDRHVADPLIGEDALDQHGAAKQQRDLDAAERNGWDQRIGKHLAQQDLGT